MHNMMFRGNGEFSDCIFLSQGGGRSGPIEILDFSIEPEQNRMRLLDGTKTAEEVESEYFGKNIVFKTVYSGNYVQLDTSTGEVSFVGLAPDFMASKTYDNESLRNAIDFCMEAIQRNNLFVYRLFTEVTQLSQKNYWRLNNVANNIMRQLPNIGVLEQIAKVSGTKFIFNNIGQEEFALNEGKKLKKVMGIPPEIQAFIKSSKMDNLFPVFQKLTGDNPNDVKDLVEYIKSLKKFQAVERYAMEQFLKELANMMSEAPDLSLRQILNHLVRENWYFGSLGLPRTELGEWKDCISMARAANIDMDKFPQNISKYHTLLQKNVNILKHPRKEEFAEAVSLYSRMTKEMTKEGFIIRPPVDEAELVKEGNLLHHCVASYRDKIIDEHCIVLFVRAISDPDTPLYTVELDYTPGDDFFSVVQFKKIYDADVLEPELLKMMNDYLQNRKTLIEGGKNLFKKPRVFKAKKDDDVTAVEKGD